VIRIALFLLLTLASCARLKIYILDDKYFAETKYDMSFEAGQEVDLVGLYELDSDSTPRLYVYELAQKNIELRARVPLRQRFSNLSGRWLRVYGFYSGTQIDAKSTEEVKPSTRDLVEVKGIVNKNALVIHQSAQLVKNLPADYRLTADFFKDVTPGLAYIDRHGRYFVFRVRGPVVPPESIAAVLHEYVSVYLVYERKAERVTHVCVLKEGWVEE